MEYTYTYRRLHRLHFYCQKILPLVYTNALSYYEVLCKVVSFLNDVSEQVDENSEAIEYLVSTIESVISKVDGFETRFTELENSIETKFDELEQQLDERIDSKTEQAEQRLIAIINESLEEIQKSIADIVLEVDEVKSLAESVADEMATFKIEVSDTINDKFGEIEIKIDKQEQDLAEYIQGELQKIKEEIVILQDVYATSPIDGKVKPLDTVLQELYDVIKNYNVYNPVYLKEDGLQNTINSLFESLRVHSITVDEYKHLGYTVDEYKKILVKSIPRGMTAIEYATQFKDIVPKANTKLYMFSSENGNKVFYADEVRNNTDLMRMSGALTISEFDEMNIKVSDINGKTVRQLDWQSNKVFS